MTVGTGPSPDYEPPVHKPRADPPSTAGSSRKAIPPANRSPIRGVKSQASAARPVGTAGSIRSATSAESGASSADLAQIHVCPLRLNNSSNMLFRNYKIS